MHDQAIIIEEGVMSPHLGDPRCVCTDGREAERDTSEFCQTSPSGAGSSEPKRKGNS